MGDSIIEYRAHTGSCVWILREDGRRYRFHRVPTIDANVERGTLSVASPLGKALLGRRRGEE